MNTKNSWFTRVVVMTIVMLSVGVFAALSYADDDPVPQQIPCPDCGGDWYAGTHICYGCWGFGYVIEDQADICPFCNGNCGFYEPCGGYGYKCGYCQGGGCWRCYWTGIDSYVYVWVACENCSETGHIPGPVTCPSCDGNGFQVCDTCEGRGYITIYE